MKARKKSSKHEPRALPAQVAKLQARLAESEARRAEAEETLRAIHEGEVDAVLVHGPKGEQIFTLKGAETPYRLLLEAMNEGALTLSQDGVILYCNSRVAEMVKRPMEEIVGASCQLCLNSRDYISFRQLLKRAKKRGAKEEFSLQTGDRKTLPVEISVRACKVDETKGFSVLVTDISERKRAERALREVNEKLEGRVKVRTRELRQANRILETKTEDLAAANEELQAQTHKLRLKSEELEAQAKELREKSDELGALNEELQGHTEELQAANEAINEERNRLETILAQMPVGVVIAEAPSGKLVMGNAAMERIFGHPMIKAQSVEHYDAYKTFHPDGRPVKNWEHPISCSLLHGKVVMGQELQIERGDGTRGIVSVNSAPIRDADGKITGAVVVLADITATKKMELELKEVRDQLQAYSHNLEREVAERTAHLEAANKALETVCYNIAHDLRAPNRSMQGFADILLETYGPQLDETAQEYLRRIAAAAQRNDQLILDMLAFARLGHAPLPCEPVSVEKSLKTVLEHLENEIREKQARIEVEKPLPKVIAHATSLKQALANLIGNALKFVAPGVTPEVKIWAEEVQPNEPEVKGQGPREHQNMVRIYVKDNGIGIGREHQEKIFHVFERLHVSGYPGTGMGLAIVKKAVERMEGRVGVESEPGKGSCFWMELPRVGQT